MKKFVFTSCLFVAFILMARQGRSQQATGDIAKLLQNYSDSTLTEKLFVHTDKEYYLSGELVWFKIYAVDGATNRPLSFSKICYVEILDTANKPVLQAKIAMNGATGNGSFYIPQSVNSGTYKLRAYSRWMKNFDTNGFFEKCISILNINKLPAVSSAESGRRPTIKVGLFPEGGNLLSGVDNRVAFKLYDNAGSGLRFTGYLISGADTIQQFAPVHNGAGTFNFTPLEGQHYTVAIVPPSGKPFIRELPAIYNEGVVMQVTDKESSFNIQLRSRGNDKLYVLVHSKGIPQSSKVVDIRNGKVDWVIEKSSLPGGVSTITVFNQNAVPLCERIVFKRPSVLMDLKIETDQPNYPTRKKVDISISADSGLPFQDSASLSMTVFKLDSLQHLPDLNISSYLLLGSEIKGQLENPGYYFSANDDRSKQALDLLLLTQGWRRFNWDIVLSAKRRSPEFVPELQGHIITGKVLHKGTRAAAPATTAFIAAPSPITLFKTALSDKDGYIKADINNFFGSNYLIVQAQDAANLAFTIDEPFSKNYTKAPFREFLNPLKYATTILDQHIGMQVQNIYNIESLQRSVLPAFIDSSAFYGNADYNYNLEKYTRFTTLEEVMREFVSIVDVRMKNKQVHLHVINSQKKEYFPNAPLNLLDGVPVFNFTRFFDLDPLKVYSLDVVAQQYILGNSVFDGILNWKTYKPALTNYDFAESTLIINYEGLQLHREFYTPIYETNDQFESHLPDFRNVLQWEPGIFLNGKTAFKSNFYTSDLPGRYAVVVQGLSSGGAPGVGITYFEVQ
jgi:hypothetical protein